MKFHASICLGFLVLSATFSSFASGEPPPTVAAIHAGLRGAISGSGADLKQVSSQLRVAIGTADLSGSGAAPREIEKAKELALFVIESLRKHHAELDQAGLDSVADTLGAVLDKFDSMIDENYEFPPATANIAPPPGVPNATAGMDPAEITDRKLREEYQAAIDAELAKRRKNEQQMDLRLARWQLLVQIASLESRTGSKALAKENLVKKFAGGGESKEMLGNMMGLEPPKGSR